MRFLGSALVWVPVWVDAVPTRLIIDTDIGGGGCMDVDDVGAICMANALADNAEVELLAVVANTNPPLGVGAISVLNEFYGRGHVPIGAYKDTDLNISQFLPYTSDLVTGWPSPIKNSTQVPRAVQVYRRVLAMQPDNSVVISSIGLLTNLAALLKSEPDEYSPLAGRELLSQKVRLLTVMGGEYPGDGLTPQGCNFCGCAFGDKASVRTAAAASSFLLSNLPGGVQVIYIGASLGHQVSTGGKLSTCTPSDNPCRRAYIDYTGGPGLTRFSWDLVTTLVAVRGVAAAGCSVCASCDGRNVVNATTGANRWAFGRATNQTYLVIENAQLAADTIDDLLCQPPKHRQAEEGEVHQ